MFKKFQALYAMMLAFYKADSLVKDGKLVIPEGKQQELQDFLGEKIKLDDVVKAMNQELADMAKDEAGEDQVLIDLKKEAMEMLREHGLSQADAEDTVDNPQATENPDLKDILTGLIAHNKKTDKLIEKLMQEPEHDTPLDKGSRNNLKDMHTKTHFLGSGKAYDAFEDRPWNQKAAGLDDKFSFGALEKGFVETLQNDADLYVREVNSDLNSLERDNFGLPPFWNIRTSVSDKVVDGNIVSGEISQARKKGWLPKNKQLIQPEESQIFPVQIDITYQGYYLQEMLTSWISNYNREGSQAYKMSFVRFLLSELDKKARQEDRKVAINGVHVKTPENATIPGRAINRGEGLVAKLWRAYFKENKFKIANVGLPSTNNIVDYVPNVIESNLKEEDKNTEGLVFYLSPSWMRKYKTRKRQLFGLDNNYDGSELMEIENYPNIRFQVLRDLEGSDFMFITDENNIELMENIPGEKSLYNFETDRRVVYIFGDYKFGVRFKHIGTKVKDGDPAEFKVQTVWCNIPPYIHDTFTQIFDDTTGEVTLPYSNVQVASNWATSITDIKGTYAGQIVKIKGDTGASGNVVSSGNMTLASTFALSSGGTLTLRVNENGTLTEVKRTTAPDVNTIEDATYVDSIDATQGADFVFSGSANATLDEILNGFEGQEIKVNGGAGGTVTINDISGNIEVASQAVLANGADNITFVKLDGVFTEVARTIA